MNPRATSAIAAAALLMAACSSTPDTSEVVLMTHDSFLASEEVLSEFTEETGITLIVLQAGDAGTAGEHWPADGPAGRRNRRPR